MKGLRSTRGSNAVDRLKLRSGNAGYTMSVTGDGLFFLSEKPGGPPLCAPLELAEFAAFVNGLGPQTPKRVSKLDVAFEKQLVKKTPSSAKPR